MADTWEVLERECKSCRECSLCETRKNVVFGVGSREAEVLFVGEGPGANEDEQGEPFVGRAGKLLDDMLDGIGFISKASNLAKMDMDTPVLFISGAMDPVGDLGRGTAKAYESFRRAGVKDVTLKLYPGLRHEILNEKEKDQVRADILAWVEEHM